MGVPGGHSCPLGASGPPGPGGGGLGQLVKPDPEGTVVRVCLHSGSSGLGQADRTEPAGRCHGSRDLCDRCLPQPSWTPGPGNLYFNAFPGLDCSHWPQVSTSHSLNASSALPTHSSRVRGSPTAQRLTRRLSRPARPDPRPCCAGRRPPAAPALAPPRPARTRTASRGRHALDASFKASRHAWGPRPSHPAWRPRVTWVLPSDRLGSPTAPPCRSCSGRTLFRASGVHAPSRANPARLHNRLPALQELGSGPGRRFRPLSRL